MSTGYIHFTDEQKEIARQTDIADLLRRQGETLKRSGSELEWRYAQDIAARCEGKETL